MRTAEPLEPSSPSSPFFHSCISLRLLPILFFTILPITRLFEFTIRPRRTSRYKFLSPPLHFLFPPLRRPPPSCSSPLSFSPPSVQSSFESNRSTNRRFLERCSNARTASESTRRQFSRAILLYPGNRYYASTWLAY